MVTTPGAALAELERLAIVGRLDELCERHNVLLLSAFGSAVRGDASAADLDLGVSFAGEPAELALLDELAAATGCDHLDLAVLDGAGPVLRSEALTGLPLYESQPGAFARAQMAALAERWDTAWLRRLDLEAMAG